MFTNGIIIFLYKYIEIFQFKTGILTMKLDIVKASHALLFRQNFEHLSCKAFLRENLVTFASCMREFKESVIITNEFNCTSGRRYSRSIKL